MAKRIWIGTVEIEYTDKDFPQKAQRAFTNITTWADDYDEFRRKSQEMLEYNGWRLLGVEQAKPVLRRHVFGDEIRDMIERTRASRTAVIHGTFHTYPSDQSAD